MLIEILQFKVKTYRHSAYPGQNLTDFVSARVSHCIKVSESLAKYSCYYTHEQYRLL
jgi:hypothetical protein